MSENFRKIKKKYLTVAIIASCVLGACLGVALTCALAVVLKTCGVNLHWAVYIPIALVLAAGAGLLFFLILRPDDKRIAKKLDRDFALKQKVQTMVEFANAEGDMHVLQREQTDEALGEVAKKRVDLKWLLKFAFIPVIALAMLFAGIFVPAKKTTGGYEEPPPYTITELHAKALESLIEDVDKKSSLEEGLKGLIVLDLNVLLDMLREAELQDEMETAVIGTVGNIDRLVAETNSYLIIGGVFAEDDALKSFSEAGINAVVDYKNYKSLTSMKRVEEREADAEERITSVLNGWKKTFLAEYKPKAEGAEEGTPLPAEEAAAKLQAFADALKGSLADARLAKFAPQSEQPAFLRTAEGDELYNAYTSLAATLEAHAQDFYKFDDNGFYENTAGKLDGFTESVRSLLAKQSYNCMMDDYVRGSLSGIFGVYVGKNDSVAPSPTDSGSAGNKGDREENGGGYGDGKHEFGSDDEILDPDSGEKKKYSDPVNPDNPEYTFYHKYYDRAMGYLNSDNPPPDDVAAYIRQYFAYLNNGMDNTNN